MVYKIVVVSYFRNFKSSKIYIIIPASGFLIPAATTSVAVHFVFRKLTSGSFPELAAKTNKYIP